MRIIIDINNHIHIVHVQKAFKANDFNYLAGTACDNFFNYFNSRLESTNQPEQ